MDPASSFFCRVIVGWESAAQVLNGKLICRHSTSFSAGTVVIASINDAFENFCNNIFA